MSKDTEQRIYRVDRTVKKILNGAVYTMFILVVIAGINIVLRYFGVHLCTYAFGTTLLSVYHFAWVVCGVIGGVCVLCRIALSPFVKSDEQEELENKVEYILQQKQASKAVQEEYNPLCNYCMIYLPIQANRII